MPGNCKTAVERDKSSLKGKNQDNKSYDKEEENKDKTFNKKEKSLDNSSPPLKNDSSLKENKKEKPSEIADRKDAKKEDLKVEVKTTKEQNLKEEKPPLKEKEDFKEEKISLKNRKNSDELSQSMGITETGENQPVATEIGEIKEDIKAENVSFEKAVSMGEKLLETAESKIEKLYERYFKNAALKMSFEEVILNFEKYLQSLLFINSLKNNELSENKVKYLYAVIKKADIFSGNQCIEDTKNKAMVTLSDIPTAILMSVAVDKKQGEENSKVLCDLIYSIYKIMCMTDGEEWQEKNKILSGITSFALFQGVGV